MTAILARTACRGSLWSCRRGAIALWAAIATPSLLMAAGVGVEVGQLALVKMELQRIADVAAEAGALRYSTTPLAQIAAGTAADLAELNGAAGASSRTWTAGTQTLVDNLVTVVVGPGLVDPTGTAVTVTVQRTMHASFSTLMSNVTQRVIQASATAEVGGVASNPQPCILGLAGDLNGVTTVQDITTNGSASVTLNGCSLRSDGGISVGGSSSVTAAGVYAAGTVTAGGTIVGTVRSNAGQVPDPYATNVALQAALTNTNTVSSRVFGDKPSSVTSLTPGTWSSWSIQGNVTLAPGLYVVTGSISVGSQASVSGTGVTIVSAGSINMNGGASLSLTAPGTVPAAGAVPAVVYASTSNLSGTFGGNSSAATTGVIYYPNGNLTFHGTTGASGATGCLEVIASTVTLTGNSNMASNCSGMGATSFGSLSSSPVTLVR